MFNQTKRDTLKKLSVTAITPLVPAVALAQEHDAGTLTNVSDQTTGVSDLLIDIVSSSSTQRHSVILTNLTDALLPVRHFSPGTIYWKNDNGQEQYLDLNALRSNVAINLAPGRATSLSVKAGKPQEAVAIANLNTGVWADDASSRIDDDTLKISLGAYQHEHRLVVYPIPQIHQFA